MIFATEPSDVGVRGFSHENPKIKLIPTMGLRRRHPAKLCKLPIRILMQDLAEDELGALMLRIVEELGWRILLDDLALVHEDHAVGDLTGKAHFVGHAQHGHALFGHKDRVFVPFFKGDEARNGSNGGFGLGLPIVAEIVQLHNGALHLHDRKPHGLRVRLELPIR